MTRPTTRASEANLQDLRRIQKETAWLETHLPDLHVLSWSQKHQPAEEIRTRSKASSGPDLSQRLAPELRHVLADVTRQLAHLAKTVSAARVALEKFLDDQGYDPTLIGTLLDEGELEQARKAKQRRDAMAGDLRWGEWEAKPERQPGRSFK